MLSHRMDLEFPKATLDKSIQETGKQKTQVHPFNRT